MPRFRAFRNASRVKKLALTVVATQLSSGEVETLRATFEALDGNGDGWLTYEEARPAPLNSVFKRAGSFG